MLSGPLNRKAGPGRHSTRPRPSGLAHARGAPAQEGLVKGSGRSYAGGAEAVRLTQVSPRLPRPRPRYLNHWTQHGGAHSDA